MQTSNLGFDPGEIEKFKTDLAKTGKPFQYVEEEEVSGDMAEFMFLGSYEGRPVIYDCLLGTLQLAYESNLLEMAEAKAKEKFPDYKGFDFEIDERGNGVAQFEESEEVEDYKAYAMYEIEEAGGANVAEYVELNPEFEFGIGLEAYLNLAEITEADIVKFIEDFNSNSLKLDPVRYSFESDDDEEDD